LIGKSEENIRVNEEITDDEVRLVTEDSEQIGIVSTEKALEEARSRDKDLVEVAPNAKPVVVKMMDYGKYKYEKQKARQAARQAQDTMKLKQLRFNPQIEEHDLDFKLNDARRFLNNNNKVKFQVFFRGRQITKPELGRRLLNKIKEELEEEGEVTKEPTMEGHMMTMVVEPS